jgi:hypothetical protein
MPLSRESEEIAEIKYDIAVQQIKKKYGELTRTIELTYRTATGREREILKLLPQRLEETAKALLDCYFERFEADGLIPEQTDLERLDRKIENIFCGGFGDYTGSLSLDITSEIDRLEQQAQKQLKVRTLELKLRKPKATYETNINQNFAPLQQGPNNTQNIGIQTANGKLQIRWSQMPEITGPNTYRVLGVGDVIVSEGDINRYNEIGGDPWIDLHDTTDFSHSVKTYLIGLLTPA